MESPDERRVSMRELARRLGVSVTTVSHALSGHRPVRPELAARIHEAAREAGYSTPLASRSRARGAPGMVGLTIPSLSNPSLSTLARSAAKELATADVRLCIIAFYEAPRARLAHCVDALRAGRIDGLIYTSDLSGDETPAASHQYPIVFVDEPIVDGEVDVATITSDNFGGGVLAGEHLRSLGHRRAVVLAGPMRLRSSDQRVEGFRSVFPEALVLHGEHSYDAGRFSTEAALSARAEFTAIFACSDLIALGAIRALEGRGRRIPGDVSIVGFDDTEGARRSSPPLSTVRQDMFGLGTAAAREILDQFQRAGPTPPGARRTSIPVELVVRESTAPPSKQG